MGENASVQQRLLDACVGKPAKVPWPHRLLHDGADEIDRLQAVNEELVEVLGIALQQLEIIGDGWDKAEKAVRAVFARAKEPGDG